MHRIRDTTLFSSLSSARARACGAILLATLAAPAHAQRAGTEVRNEVFVGSEIEDYLRALQVGGLGGLYPWSLRGFSPGEVERILPADSVHPWMEHHPLRPDSSDGLRVRPIRPLAQAVYNTTFPYGQNDGPIWAGRGVTTAVRVGAALRFGILSATLAPVVFWSENRDFPLQENGEEGRLRLADGVRPRVIDNPQRPGDGPYARIDAGQSTVRADVGGASVGISSANQHWGPARYHPLILGNNAPGFAHAFLGTSHPANLWVGRLHGRIVVGRLEQSSYSSMSPDSARRVMSGLVAVFTPRGAPGVELGFSRFFHSVGRPRLALETLWKKDVRDPHDEKGPGENQLASVFFRTVFPTSGVELYGEFGREDHSWDLRDFLLEPDHASAYVVGLNKVWRPAAARMVAVGAEVANSQVTHLVRVRTQGPFYQHTGLRQGHTHRGEILGSPAIYGGGGSVARVDYFHPDGRWGLAWIRAMRQADRFPPRGRASAGSGDTHHVLQGDLVRMLGRWEVKAGVSGVYNRKRHFTSDVFNLNASLAVSASL